MVQSYVPVLKKKKLDLYIAIVILLHCLNLLFFVDFMMHLICFYIFNILIFKIFLSLTFLILNFMHLMALMAIK